MPGYCFGGAGFTRPPPARGEAAKENFNWTHPQYGAFLLSKFILLFVFITDIRFSSSTFVLFKSDIRFPSSTFVLFKSDVRFSSSTFVLFMLDVRFF